MIIQPQTDGNRAGRGRHAQITGNLAIGHAAGGLGQQLWQDVRPFEPVGRGERLGAEGAAALPAEEPLDTHWLGVTTVGADALVAPPGVELPMVETVGVGAVGWNEAGVVGVHALAGASSGPETISAAHLNC